MRQPCASTPIWVAFPPTRFRAFLLSSILRRANENGCLGFKDSSGSFTAQPVFKKLLRLNGFSRCLILGKLCYVMKFGQNQHPIGSLMLLKVEGKLRQSAEFPL